MKQQTAKKVIDAALELPASQKAKVVEELLATLEGEPDRDVDAAWAAEIEQRTRQIERGEVLPVSWSRVKKSASRRARAKS